MKAHIRLVAVTVSWALAAADPGLAAVMVMPSAGRTAPVPIAPGAIITPGGWISGPLLSLGGTISMPDARLTLPTAPTLRPGRIAVPLPAAAASNLALSMNLTALPREAVAFRAEGGSAAAAESKTPGETASLLREAGTGFRQRLALLSRAVEGVITSRDIAGRRGELGRLFDLDEERTTAGPVPAGGDDLPIRPDMALLPAPKRAVKAGESSVVEGHISAVRATLRVTVGVLSREEAARGITAYLDATGLKHRLSEDKGWLASDFVLAIEGAEAPVREHAEKLSRMLRRWPASTYDGVSFTPAWQVVPPWFDAGGLTFVRLGNASDMSSSAVLRRGRYELKVSLDANGRGAAVFTKNVLNPLGTGKNEDVALLTEALRKDIADILRMAQDVDPVSGDDKAVLNWMLAVLEDSSPAELLPAGASNDAPSVSAAAVPVPAEAPERRASAAHALRLTNAVVAVGTLAGTAAALLLPAPSLALGAAAAGLLILALTALDALWGVFEIPYAGWAFRVVGVAAALVFITGIVGIIVLPS